MAFCDFCDCDMCRNGEHGITHAETDDGRWICEVCWRYDVCVRAKVKMTPRQYGPCEDSEGRPISDCEHRPRLVTKFHK